jgi:hypothetical protein
MATSVPEENATTSSSSRRISMSGVVAAKFKAASSTMGRRRGPAHGLADWCCGLLA